MLLTQAAVVGMIVLTALGVVLLSRLGELVDLRRRVLNLEEDVERLRRRLRSLLQRIEPPAPDAVEIPTAEMVQDGAPPGRERPRPKGKPAAPATWPGRHELESWLGQYGLGWAAAGLLLLAVGFFLKHAFENGWIGEVGRVSLGILAGTGLCVAGFRAHRHGNRLFAQILTATGASLLYLCTYCAFGFYSLLPQERAAIYLVIVMVQMAALAVLYEAPAIALMAVLGGLITPVLLRADHDQYQSLFLYLVLLDVGVLALGLFRDWPYIAPVALAGTQALFWAWYAQHYHPEKLPAALTFQAIVFGLFLLHDTLLPRLRRGQTSLLGLAEILANAFLACVAGYVLLEEEYRPFLPLGAVGLALLYLALGWLALRRPVPDPRLVLVEVAASAGLLGVAIGLRAHGGWIALGWAAEGLALGWVGARIRTPPLRVLGHALLVLAVVRLVLMDSPWLGRPPFWFLLNSYAVPALLVAGCVIGAALVYRQRMPDAVGVDLQARWVFGLGGVLLVWLILSFEVYQSLDWVVRGSAAGEGGYQEGLLLAQAGLSVLWAVYAASVLAAGLWLKHPPLRVLALGLFGLTLAKVLLVDMADLSGIYRVLAFFVLSLMMGGAAWGYQRLGRAARVGKQTPEEVLT